MKGKTIGYVRVSSADQNISRQLEGEAVDKTFTDHCSGKDTNRPELKACLDYVREGDVLVVHSMDRLARNLEDLRRLVRELNTRGVVVKFVKEGLSFSGESSPINDLMLNLLGAVAEFERQMIRERQREGIAAAKRRGDVYKGRKSALSAEAAARLLERAKAGAPKVELAAEFGISRQAVYDYINKASGALQ